MLDRLRAALGDMIAATNRPIMKAADLHHALGIDRRLSWAIYNVATTTDGLRAGPYVPRPMHLKTFFRAAAKHGISAELIAAAVGAAKDFEDTVARHAGDRAMFDSMVSAIAGDDEAETIDRQQRRSVFRGLRHLWGVQVRTRVTCTFVHRSADPEFADFVTLMGYIGLRQSRHGAPVVISHASFANDDGSPIGWEKREPLDPAAQTEHGIALLPDFCSQPLPQFRTIEASGGQIHGDLVLSDVGDTAAVDYIAGWIDRHAVKTCRTSDNRFAGFCARTRIPCELLIHDVVVLDGMYASDAPTAVMYPESIDEGPFPARPRSLQRLEFKAAATCLGNGAKALRTPEVPRYGEVAEYVFNRLGWDGERFKVYRCRVAYPMLPSTTAICFTLPERSEASAS